MSSPSPRHGADPGAESDEAAHDRAAPGGFSRSLRRAWHGAGPARRRYVVVGIVLTVLGIAMASWWGVSSAAGKPHWQTVAYDVEDATTVMVRFDVTRPADMPLVCTVEAQETGHGVVGRNDVTVPGGEAGQVRIETRVRTSSLAVYGSVRRCAPA